MIAIQDSSLQDSRGTGWAPLSGSQPELNPEMWVEEVDVALRASAGVWVRVPTREERGQEVKDKYKLPEKKTDK